MTCVNCSMRPRRQVTSAKLKSDARRSARCFAGRFTGFYGNRHHSPTKGYDAGTARDRVLSNDEMRKLWQWLNGDALPRGHANVMKLQLLLGARCGEVAVWRRKKSMPKSGFGFFLLHGRRTKNSVVTPLIGLARMRSKTSEDLVLFLPHKQVARSRRRTSVKY